jgi:outer membrane protein assembly factor BamD
MIKKWYLFLILLLLLGCASGRRETPLLGAEEQFTLAKKEYEKKHYSDARMEFQKLIYNYPGSAFIDSSQYFLGMCYFKEEDYSAAVGEFKKLLSSFSNSPLADDAFYMIASAHFEDSPKAELDQRSTLSAIGELKDFLEEYPLSEYREEAQRLLFEAQSKISKKLYKSGALYFKLKHYEAARIYLQEILEQYPESNYSVEANFLIAESYLKQKKYDLAELEYRKFLKEYPENRLAAKVKKRLKKLDEEKIQANK